MELTYMVRGADGKEYGPATLEQLSQWIQEGRLPAHQPVRRSDMQHWAMAREFEELKPLLPSTGAVTGAAPQAGSNPASIEPKNIATYGQLKSGASWFHWIAGLSLINSIAAASGASWRFIVGLGITQAIDQLVAGGGGAGKGIALALDLAAAGLFVLFSVFAHKGHTWAFVVGMALFALDGLIFLIARDWIDVAFHVFVLYCLFRGFSACRQLNAQR